MAFTKQGDFTDDFTTLADKPNKTAAEMKAMFQSQPGELKTTLNNALDLLMAVTDGASGADNVGMTAITETGANATVQSIIEALITRLKATTDGASGADLIGSTTIAEVTGTTAQAQLESIKTLIGTLANLTTTEKTNLVGAVNEHLADKASLTELAHIKIGTAGSIDANGVYTPTGFKIGSFTRDLTVAAGTQAINGVGFTPRAIIFLAAVNSTAEVSTGIDIGSNPSAIYSNHLVSAGTWVVNTFSIGLVESGTATSAANVQSMDADGFTLNWVKNGSPTGTATIKYLAIR